jgi:hypothetical protein
MILKNYIMYLVFKYVDFVMTYNRIIQIISSFSFKDYAIDVIFYQMFVINLHIILAYICLLIMFHSLYLIIIFASVI